MGQQNRLRKAEGVTTNVVRDRSMPPLPSSMRGYAIATLGIVNATNVHARCIEDGFVPVGDGYVHPDGSWVDVMATWVTVGWKGYRLGDMQHLYRANTGWE
jgi:hypothetical protein